MQINVDELLSHAIKFQREHWVTLVKKAPFQYSVTSTGIEYVPSKSAIPRHVLRRELESFCDDFEKQKRSYSPGNYPDRWHKSYTLPLLKHYIESIMADR